MKKSDVTKINSLILKKRGIQALELAISLLKKSPALIESAKVECGFELRQSGWACSVECKGFNEERAGRRTWFDSCWAGSGMEQVASRMADSVLDLLQELDAHAAKVA